MKKNGPREASHPVSNSFTWLYILHYNLVMNDPPLHPLTKDHPSQSINTQPSHPIIYPSLPPYFECIWGHVFFTDRYMNLKYNLNTTIQVIIIINLIVLKKMSDFMNKCCLRNSKRKYSQNRVKKECCYVYHCDKCTKVQITKISQKEVQQMEEETQDIQCCQDRQNMYFCVVQSEDFKAYTEDETETELLQF